MFEEIMIEKFPNFMKDINLQMQETLNRMNSKKTMPRHIITKPLKTKNKDKILKPAIRKQ